MTSASPRLRTALSTYLVMGAIDIVLGVRYFASTQFMPYHARAADVPWPEIEAGVRTVMLALMKVAGAGWFVLGTFTIVLALSAFRAGSTLARWALPVGTLAFYLLTFLPAWEVHRQTGAPTPWVQAIVGFGFAALALVLDAPWSRRVPAAGRNGADRPRRSR